MAFHSGTVRVTALRAGIDLPISHQEGLVVVQLPDIDLFEVLLLEEHPSVVREVVRDLDQKGSA
jgi:hypothetical protein